MIPSNRAEQDKKSAEKDQIHVEKGNEVEGDLIVNEVENSPSISSKTVVDETPSQHVKVPLEYKISHSGDSRKRGNLILDLSKAEDKGPELINLGDSSILEGSSQSTMCKFLRQIFINKPRRKRRRGPIRNPFDIGRCKLRKGQNKFLKAQAQRLTSMQASRHDLDKEAEEIITIAENMGLTLKEDRSLVLKKIKEQLEQAVL